VNLTVEEIEKQGKKAIETLEKLTAVRVPKTLKDAVNEDWLALFKDGGMGIMESVPKKELKEWNQRAISMRNANELLHGIENALVREFVHRPDSPVVVALKRITAVPRFVLSHIGDIVALGIPLALEGVQDFAEVVALKAAIGMFEAELAIYFDQYDERGRLIYKAPSNASGVNDRIIGSRMKGLLMLEEDLRTVENRLAIAVTAILAVIAYWTVERVIALCANAAAYKAKVAETVLKKDEVVKLAKDFCLPQRRRQAFRRRSPSRK